MKAQLEETSNAARKLELHREEMADEDALRRGEDYLRLTIEDRQRAEALLAGENQILEMIATGRPLAVILDGLCRLVDKLCDKSLVSILLMDPTGRCLRRGAGPSFPEAFLAAVDGIEIGPCVGSCGTAAYRKEQVIVSDIETSPLWTNYLELARAYGLRAGWSTPILSSDGSVLGTFAIYWLEPRSPGPHHQQIIKQITHLTAVAIERKRSAESLRASELLHTGLHCVCDVSDLPIVRVRVGSGPNAIWREVLDDGDWAPALMLFKAHLRELGVHTILFVPMFVAGRVAGFIGIRFTLQRDFRQEEIELTRALAHQATLAIQLTRLSAQSRQSAVMAERNRMARDIHDTLAQGFTGVIVQLEAAGEAMSQSRTAIVSDQIGRASCRERV